MLREQEMNKGGGDTSTGNMALQVQAIPTLAEVGITRMMSSKAQKIGYVTLRSRQNISPIPIPAAIWLFGTALIGLVGFGKRKTAA